jgi:hypothetical protein
MLRVLPTQAQGGRSILCYRHHTNKSDFVQSLRTAAKLLNVQQRACTPTAGSGNPHPLLTLNPHGMGEAAYSNCTRLLEFDIVSPADGSSGYRVANGGFAPPELLNCAAESGVPVFARGKNNLLTLTAAVNACVAGSLQTISSDSRGERY